MFRLTAIAGRFSAIGLSGAVHAAIFLSPLGHPAVASRGGEVVTVDVQVETETATPPAPVAPLENRAPAYPTHTHPYPVPASHDWTPHDPSLVHLHHDPVEPAPKADTRSIVAADSQMPKFSMVVSSGAPGAGGLATSAEVAAAAMHHHDDDDDGEALPERAVDTPARLARGLTPSYPSDARAAGIEAPVQLELVVSPAGMVEDVRVTRPAGHGLDEAAAQAARRFVFLPAVKGRHPVRVRMRWVVDFRLD